MNKTTLVVMAAGLGSRFGGEKQIEPIGPNGEFLIHYSIYDAISVGFNKIVFVIKEENLEYFKNKIGRKIENLVEVYYVFQNNNSLKDKVNIPDREKPLGTGHCIYCVKDIVKEKFGVVNADDFYGRDAYRVLYDALNRDDSKFYLVGYPLGKTMSSYGSVKRGVCVLENSSLKDIVECKIERVNDKIMASTLHGSSSFEVYRDTIVSMSMYGFNSSIFEYMDSNIIDFFKNTKEDINTVEYFLPEVVSGMIEKSLVNVLVINTSSNWFGITYKEDLVEVKDNINKLINSGEYPNRLF